MTRSRFRSAGPVGGVVVLAFLGAYLSSPLRPCSSHEGHAHDAFFHRLGTEEKDAHAGHLPPHLSRASDAPAEGGAHGGCECVGLCQLETPPLPSLDGTFAQAALAEPSTVSAFDTGELPVARAPHAITFARGPPPVA